MKIPGKVMSLKERRRHVNSLRDSLKNRFNISIRETSLVRPLNLFTLVAAYVALNSGEIEALQSAIYRILEETELETIEFKREIA